MKMKLSFVAALLVMCLAAPANALNFQKNFDYLGPEMKKFTNSQGRELIYTDEGEKDWRTVIFIGGSGTSAQAFYMTEFARTLRNDLKLRVICLERNGFGMTGYVKGQTYQDYANNVRELLNHLGVDKFAAIGISGGGPYLAAIGETMPERIISLHFAAAFSFAEVDPLSSCKAMAKDRKKWISDLTGWIRNPMVWWDLGANTSVHKIPAFQDTANNEGAHSFFIRGQMGDPTPAIAEYTTYCTVPKPKAPSALTAPIYIYQGDVDKSVTIAHAAFWQQHYPNSQKVTARIYPGEGHDVQYRHWDQILLDMAGMGDKVLICRNGRASMAAPEKAEERVKSGAATLGLCAWQ